MSKFSNAMEKYVNPWASNMVVWKKMTETKPKFIEKSLCKYLSFVMKKYFPFYCECKFLLFMFLISEMSSKWMN